MVSKLCRMHVIVALVLLAIVTNAEARFPRGSAGSSSGAPTGYSEINLSPGDSIGGFLNVIDTGNSQSFFNGATPAQIDANGIPSSPLTASQVILYTLHLDDYLVGSPTTQWVFKWTPSGDAVINLFGWPVSVVGSPTGCSTAGSFTITMTAGTPCRVVFTFSSAPGGFDYQLQFLAAAYAPGSPKPVICRVSDEAAVTAGEFYTAEYLSTLAGLNLKTLRFMPWILGISNSDNLAAWGYRSTPSMIGWQSDRTYPGIYGGAISGTDFYTMAPGASTPLTDWTDGETVQGNLTNASTLIYSISNAVNNGSGLIRLTVNSTTGMSTGQKIYISDVNGTLEALGVQTITVVGTPGTSTTIDLQGTAFVNAYTGGGKISVQTLTITGKTNGTKLVTYYNGTAGQILGPGLSSFTYNAAWNVLLWKDGGITAGFPIEAMVQLSNRLKLNMWYTLPMLANDNFVTSLGAYIRDNLNAALSLYFEYSNETWQGGPQSQYAARQGNYFQLGYYWGYTGVRFAMIQNLIKPVWTATGRSASTLRRSLMWQAFGDANVQFYILNGTLNDPTNNRRLCLYLGGTFSGTCSGAPNYSVTGSRPVDYADVVGYALYFSGWLTGSSGFDDANVQAGISARLQTLATAFNSNPADPTSLATLDDDVRQGVYSVGAISSVSGTTINATANGTVVNQQIIFYSTGTLASPLVAGKIYFVVSPATNSFSVSASAGGAAISLSGGSGTMSFGSIGTAAISPPFLVTGQSLLELMTSIVQNTVNSPCCSPGWEGIIASYDSYRTGAGLPLLRTELYEGGLEALTPTAAQCAAMGITVGGSSVTAANALAAGLDAYKKSAYGRALSLSLYNQFMGADASASTFGVVPHSRTPSWFLLSSPSGIPGRWSLLPSVIGSTPYQTYDGIGAFVGQLNFLLKRDLDPATNDNEPVGLGKAA